jgi:hypothetical protein
MPGMITTRAILQPAILTDPTLSSYREQLVEYAFVSALLQDGWIRREQRIDVLRADVDGAGYDLVVECQGVTRHVQVKSSVLGGRARAQNINAALARHPSGCVVWVSLELSSDSRVEMSYLSFGGDPGSPLPDLSGYRVGKHARANSKGVKALRPSIRLVPRSVFAAFREVAALSDWLFGPPAEANTSRRAAGSR